MSRPKFQIGDAVYHARTKTRPVYLQCTECMGKKFLTVILGDDSQVTIECDCCKRGWMGAQGSHEVYEHYEEVELGEIIGVELRGGIFEYRVYAGPQSSWVLEEDKVFAREADAKTRAEELAKERTAEAAKTNCRKHNSDRSWAWNVRYHRKAIQDAQQSLAQHTAALNYAQSVAKQEKE